MRFLPQTNWTIVHSIFGSRIRTHNLLNMESPPVTSSSKQKHPFFMETLYMCGQSLGLFYQSQRPNLPAAPKNVSSKVLNQFYFSIKSCWAGSRLCPDGWIPLSLASQILTFFFQISQTRQRHLLTYLSFLVHLPINSYLSFFLSSYLSWSISLFIGLYLSFYKALLPLCLF